MAKKSEIVSSLILPSIALISGVDLIRFDSLVSNEFVLFRFLCQTQPLYNRTVCPRACKWCSNLNPPTTSPTSEPTRSPTRSPTHNPTESPSESPTGSPSQDPSFQPSASKYPSESPSEDVRRALQVENHIKQSPKKDAEPEKLTLFE